MRHKIEIYGTYIFDITNKLKIRENGTATVQVLGKKRRFLKRALYKCISLQTGEIFNCTKQYLTPIPNSTEYLTLIRYPDDIPAINDRDLQVINTIIATIDIENSDASFIRFFKDLQKLQTKLQYYYGVNDV